MSCWLRWRVASSQGAALAGMVAGLTVLAAPLSLATVLLLWLAIFPPQATWRMRLFYWLALLAAALPRLFTTPLVLNSLDQWWRTGANVQPVETTLLFDSPLAGGIFVLLAFFGLVYLLRFIRWVPALFILAGVLLVGVFMLATGEPMNLSLAAPMLALFSLSAVVAVDQLGGHTIQFWSPLLRPATSLAAIALLLVILLGVNLQADADNGANEAAAIPQTETVPALAQFQVDTTPRPSDLP
jgi:hypothetical protein